MSRMQAFSAPGRLETAEVKTANRHIISVLLSLVSAALLLRIGGMVNQAVASASFGAGAAMDAYFVAAAFPLLLTQLLGSALEAAVVPVYSRLRLCADREATSKLLCTLIHCLVPGVGLLALVLFVLRQPLAFFSAPGLGPGRLAQVVILEPLLYLALPFSLLISLVECVLNVEGQFGWPAYAGLLVPLTTAALTLVGGKTWGIKVLCIGSLLGTVFQLLSVLLRAKWAGLHYSLAMNTRSPEFRLILTAIWPILLGALITQGSPLVDQIFASTLSPGSISSLNYALKLVSLFTGIIFVSVGRAVFPSLAAQAVANDIGYRTFKRTLRLFLWGMGLCILIFSLLLPLLGQQVITLLFQHGAFSPMNTHNTALVLVGFAPGLVPMALGFLLSRAFNALGETRVPMYGALLNVGTNALFDALFARLWQAPGIALATSAVSLITCLFLLFYLRRKIGPLQLWYAPFEIWNMISAYKSRLCERCSFVNIFSLSGRYPYAGELRRYLLYICVTLSVLTVGVIATVRDVLATLRLEIGVWLCLCFWRYPYILLLCWASIDVCFGSSLAALNGNNLDLVLIFPLMCWLAFLSWQETFRLLPGTIWMALYLLWVLFGINLSPLDTRAFLTLWLTMLAEVGTGILCIFQVTTRRRLLGLVDILLATGTLVALYGLYGFITHQRGEVDPDTSLFRVTSLFTQATTLAFYLSSLIPLACFRLSQSRGVSRLVGLGVLFCLLGTLLLTFTRSAYVAVFLEMVIMALCASARVTRRLGTGGMFALGGVALYLGWSLHLSLLARFFAGDVATFNGRVYLWQALLRNFQVTRWLGSGLQSSDQLLHYLQVGTAGQGVIGTAPHSLFLGTLYDHGIIGLFFLCMGFCLPGYRLLRGIWRRVGAQRTLYAASIAALVSVLLQSFGSRDLWIQAAGAPFWIIMALPFARYWSAHEHWIPEYRGKDSRQGLGGSQLSDGKSLSRIDKCVKGKM